PGEQAGLDAREVVLQEGAAGALFEVLWGPLSAHDRHRRSHVGEGTQHAGNIPQRRALLATLEQRPGGLALEVDDQPAARRMQRLAEVEVAMGPNAAAAEHQLGAMADLLAHVLSAPGDG